MCRNEICNIIISVCLLIMIFFNIMSIVESRLVIKYTLAMKKGIELNDIDSYVPGRKRDILIKEISLSPIPVFLQSKKEYQSFMSKTRENFDIKTNDNVIGLFEHDNSMREWPKMFIYVNSSLPIEEAISTLFHEIGHYECYKNSCECFKQNDDDGGVFKEFHAYMYSLKCSKDKNLLDVLISSVKYIESMTKYSEKNNTEKHYVAARQVIQTKLWKDCIIFIHKRQKINFQTSSFLYR